MNDFLINFSFSNIFDFFLKTSLIILSFIYILYALVSYKNIKAMSKTLEDKFNYLINFISYIQLFFGLILLIFSIFLI